MQKTFGCGIMKKEIEYTKPWTITLSRIPEICCEIYLSIKKEGIQYNVNELIED